jgi:hypothetical protein
MPYAVLVEGDSVASARWSVTPEGPVFSGQADTPGGSRVLVSGICLSKTYTLRCSITGNAGGVFVRSIQIKGVRK